MMTNNSNNVIVPSSNAGCYFSLPPLQRSGSSFCLPFPCVFITSLNMHSHERLLVSSAIANPMHFGFSPK